VHNFVHNDTHVNIKRNINVNINSQKAILFTERKKCNQSFLLISFWTCKIKNVSYLCILISISLRLITLFFYLRCKKKKQISRTNYIDIF